MSDLDQLPRGWRSTTLGCIARLINGDRGENYPSQSDFVVNGVPFINAGHLISGKLDLSRMKFISQEHYERLGSGKVLEGDVLYCLRGSLGKTAIVVDIKIGAIASSLVIIRLNEAVDTRYIHHFLSGPQGKNEIDKYDNGSAQPNLSSKSLSSFQVPLPPLPEQQRIADKLDTMLARVDACRERLDVAASLLKRFRQSVLHYATTGALAFDWASQHPKQVKAARVQLGSVASELSYGSSAKSSKTGDVAVLRMGNLQGGEVDWTDLVFTSDRKEIAKYTLTNGDVLFNRTNSPELVGKTSIYRGEREAIYAGYLIRVRCSEKLLPEYLNFCLNSPAGRAYCWQVKSDGVSQSNINAKKLAAFEFLLPSVSEQEEVVRRVRKLFHFADHLEARLINGRLAVERLKPALLAKAFRGELVPQDPNDEPASKLLKRLAGERSATGVAAKNSRGRKATRAVEDEEENSVAE